MRIHDLKGVFSPDDDTPNPAYSPLEHGTATQAHRPLTGMQTPEQAKTNIGSRMPEQVCWNTDAIRQ
jgi:hypothetical protein